MELKIHMLTNWQLLLEILNAKSKEGYQLIENKKHTYMFEKDEKKYFYFMVGKNTCVSDDIIQKAELVDWDFYHTLSWKLIPKRYRMHLYRIDQNICNPEEHQWADVQQTYTKARIFLFFYYVQLEWFIVACLLLNILIEEYKVNIPSIVKALITFGVILLASDFIMNRIDQWQSNRYRKMYHI